MEDGELDNYAVSTKGWHADNSVKLLEKWLLKFARLESERESMVTKKSHAK